MPNRIDKGINVRLHPNCLDDPYIYQKAMELSRQMADLRDKLWRSENEIRRLQAAIENLERTKDGTS